MDVESFSIEFNGIWKGYIELSFASFNITFLHPIKLYVELLTIHYCYNMLCVKCHVKLQELTGNVTCIFMSF